MKIVPIVCVLGLLLDSILKKNIYFSDFESDEDSMENNEMDLWLCQTCFYT